MTIKDDIKKKLNKIKEQINRKDFSEKENKKYKESMISINKHYHKGEYDKVDKILDKLENDILIRQTSADSATVTFQVDMSGVSGCTDDQSCNYNALANTDDGSCDYSCIGCMDNNATNYDLTATQEYDGSCIVCDYPDTYIFTVEIHNLNDNNNNKFYINSYDGEIQISKTIKNTDFEINGVGYHLYCLPLGCYRFISNNNEVSYKITDLFGTVYLDQTGSIPNNFTYSNSIDIDFGLLVLCDISGCTESQCFNYNISATINDGSCICVGCTNSAACNYDSNANFDDGSCEFSSCNIDGCTNSVACNYDSNANVDDNSCEFVTCTGCTVSAACNYDSNANVDDGSCEFDSCGCIDTTACNYDSNANFDDGSCEFYSCAGCTDPSALNYNEAATIEDGGCCYSNLITITSNGFDIEIMDLNNNEVLFHSQYLYENSSQYLYENSYCLASGCYKLNPSINATINNNFWSIEGIFSGKITGGENDIEPIYISVGGNNCIYGCTIQCACNYNSEASIYDGTCEYGSCSGCTYSNATNYDESAGNDDGSCEFQLANPCPADINGDGSVTTADLLQFLGAFGTICD